MDRAADVRAEEVDFATRWDVAHHVDPELDWRVKALRIRCADSFCRLGVDSKSVADIDEALKELVSVSEKPQSIEAQYLQDITFDATSPPSLLFGPKVVERAFDDIADAYQTLGYPNKAADARRLQQEFKKDCKISRTETQFQSTYSVGGPVMGRLIKPKTKSK